MMQIQFHTFVFFFFVGKQCFVRLIEPEVFDGNHQSLNAGTPTHAWLDETEQTSDGGLLMQIVQVLSIFVLIPGNDLLKHRRKSTTQQQGRRNT